MAEQKQPIKRRVALKIIKIGMDTREVVARFEAERQALAVMDHPNIAKVFDAGVTGAAESQIANRKSQISRGRPYFVMELVRGIKITDYCDEKNFSTRERLELFNKVCEAVQHAHQKGIIQMKQIIPLLRGDLDWIVMKCLEKDRARRYETANGLAMDLQRHLNNEPVVACPPSNLYKFQKSVRRNKLAFAAASAVTAALVIGLGLSTWMSRKEFWRDRLLKSVGGGEDMNPYSNLFGPERITLKKAVGTTDFADFADEEELRSERVFTLWVGEKTSTECAHFVASVLSVSSAVNFKCRFWDYWPGSRKPNQNFRHGIGARHQDLRLLRPEQPAYARAARPLYQSLPGHSARAPEEQRKTP